MFLWVYAVEYLTLVFIVATRKIGRVTARNARNIDRHFKLQRVANIYCQKCSTLHLCEGSFFDSCINPCFFFRQLYTNTCMKWKPKRKRIWSHLGFSRVLFCDIQIVVLKRFPLWLVIFFFFWRALSKLKQVIHFSSFQMFLAYLDCVRLPFMQRWGENSFECLHIIITIAMLCSALGMRFLEILFLPMADVYFLWNIDRQSTRAGRCNQQIFFQQLKEVWHHRSKWGQSNIGQLKKFWICISRSL